MKENQQEKNCFNCDNFILHYIKIDCKFYMANFCGHCHQRYISEQKFRQTLKEKTFCKHWAKREETDPNLKRTLKYVMTECISKLNSILDVIIYNNEKTVITNDGEIKLLNKDK